MQLGLISRQVSLGAFVDAYSRCVLNEGPGKYSVAFDLLLHFIDSPLQGSLLVTYSAGEPCRPQFVWRWSRPLVSPIFLTLLGKRACLFGMKVNQNTLPTARCGDTTLPDGITGGWALQDHLFACLLAT